MEHFGLSHILYEPDKYNPDTLDLVIDEEAREYWLNTCEKLVDKYVNFALNRTEDPTVEIRVLKFKTCYIEALKELRLNPLAQGQLTIRLLLDINETCLRSQGFFDLWKEQKKYENDAALTALASRISEIDALPDDRQKWTEICKGVIAGNMFDWGAQAVASILDSGLYVAMEKIQKRPWLYDGLEKWIEKLEEQPHETTPNSWQIAVIVSYSTCWPHFLWKYHHHDNLQQDCQDKQSLNTVHHCAAIFVDNSGVDIVLGILPFVRALLLRGTSVILCANEWPALNDVTFVELEEILQHASLICPVLAAAISAGDLVVRSNGQRGPCLDLRTISVGLSTEMKKRGVDLIVLEGMGRALHTNFNARLAVDALKLAVVKNAWLAQRLGGPLFSVIFIYEDKPTET